MDSVFRFIARGLGIFAHPFLACLMCLMPFASACASANNVAGADTPIQPQPAVSLTVPRPEKEAPDSLQTDRPAPCWQPLIRKLCADGLNDPDLFLSFTRLGESHSQVPMGTKITELFKNKFLKPPPPQGAKVQKPAKSRIYPGFVTPANLERCRDFLRANTVAFTKEAKLYGVPKEIVVSLLFVETRLGSFLGRDNAFMSLASMAVSTSPEHIPDALALLPVTPERLEWVKERLQQRSDWAYKELKALLVHSRANKLDPLSMPGSIYGAVGLCQFMPSNFKPYAVDGNGDGKVDLFEPADAIMSVGNYLRAHGWKKNMERSTRHTVLLRYNKSSIYANTILALAEALDPPPVSPRSSGKKSALQKVKKSSNPTTSKAATAPPPKVIHGHVGQKIETKAESKAAS